MLFHVTEDYDDGYAWHRVEADTMDAAANKFVEERKIELGSWIWVAMRDGEDRFIIEMVAYEVYQPEMRQARRLP